MAPALIAAKTVHFTNSWHGSSGGVSTFYRALMNFAHEVERPIALVVPGEQDGIELWNEHATIHTVRGPQSPFDRNYRYILPHRYLHPGSRIAGILQREQPDIVEVCDKYTLPYLAGLLRVGHLPGISSRPTVVGLSCERLDENLHAYGVSNEATHLLARLYMKWIYFALCDHHIAVTMHTGSELEVASRGHKVRRGVWIEPMGVDASTFHAFRRHPEARRQLLRRCAAPEDAILLLYVGRLAPEKNLELLLSSARTLFAQENSKYHLVVAGNGPLLGRLQSEAAAFSGHIHLLGHLNNREQLADLYANCDVFIHPNPREPFGIAPLEAMASGLPLVCPETGGVRSYATALSAWLAPTDTSSYVSAILQAGAESESKRQKVRQARITAEQHDWPAVCARYFRLYDELHAFCVTGREPSSLPRFYSTTGDWLGRESGVATGAAADETMSV